MQRWKTVGAFIVGLATVISTVVAIWAVRNPPAEDTSFVPGVLAAPEADAAEPVTTPGTAAPTTTFVPAATETTATTSAAPPPPSAAVTPAPDPVTTVATPASTTTPPSPPTAPPSAAPTAPDDPAGTAAPAQSLSAPDTVALIETYLRAAGNAEYERAFALLSPQEQLEQGGYEAFRAFWTNIEEAGGLPDGVEVEVVAAGVDRLTVRTMLFYDPIGQERSEELVTVVVVWSEGRLVMESYDADQLP